MPTITAAQLKEQLTNNEEIFLVDVRSKEEHEEENIGGINVPLAEIEAGQFARIPTDKEVVLYCRTGARSGLAQALLIQKGFRVQNLEGGVMGFNA